jgi:hypothetical protein
MATAQRPPLSMMAETPEEQAALQKVLASRKALEDALQSRENQFFDPVLLAMAQGFLAPTKTGSFGESLGNVAAMVGPAQAGEEKRAMDIAQMRSELAAQELGMAQATRGERQFQNLIRQARGEAPEGAAAAPAGAPAQAAAGAPAGAQAAQPAAQAGAGQAGFRALNPLDIIALGKQPGQAEAAKALMDAVKLERDRFIVDQQSGRVWDKVNQAFVPGSKIPFEKQEVYTIGNKRYAMLPSQHDEYMAARAKGKGAEWMTEFLRPDVPGAAPRMSQEEIEAQAAGLKESATKTAQAEVGRTQEAIGAGSVTDRMASYAALEAIAGRKDASEIFGIVNRPDVGSAIINLVKETVRAGPGVSLSAPALENALRNVGLSQEQINRYQFALGIMAQIQLQQAKLAAGQGSVSNFERELFGQASISPQDNPETIVKKVQMLRARAEFDREFARELRKSKMSADEFKEEREAQWNRMVKNYEERVANIASTFGVKAGAIGAAPSGATADAAAELRRKLGLPTR